MNLLQANIYQVANVQPRFSRYRINTKSGKVVPSQFPNSIKNRFINNFDFPTINEDYRGKAYCIVYGWSAIDYSRQVEGTHHGQWMIPLFKNPGSCEEERLRLI